MRTRVLVVDDEPDLVELIHYNLTKAGYDVAGVLSGEEALAHVRSSLPDLIVLDVLLPGLDGLEVCKTLRRNPTTAGIPIVMLTARSEDADVVAGLELGADDYLTKPFSPRVLLARIKAVLRRQQPEAEAETTVVCDDVMIHPGRYEVRTGDQHGVFNSDRVPYSALFGATPRVGVHTLSDRRCCTRRGCRGD